MYRKIGRRKRREGVGRRPGLPLRARPHSAASPRSGSGCSRRRSLHKMAARRGRGQRRPGDKMAPGGQCGPGGPGAGRGPARRSPLRLPRPRRAPPGRRHPASARSPRRQDGRVPRNARSRPPGRGGGGGWNRPVCSGPSQRGGARARHPRWVVLRSGPRPPPGTESARARCRASASLRSLPGAGVARGPRSSVAALPQTPTAERSLMEPAAEVPHKPFFKQIFKFFNPFAAPRWCCSLRSNVVPSLSKPTRLKYWFFPGIAEVGPLGCSYFCVSRDISVYLLRAYLSVCIPFFQGLITEYKFNPHGDSLTYNHNHFGPHLFFIYIYITFLFLQGFSTAIYPKSRRKRKP